MTSPDPFPAAPVRSAGQARAAFRNARRAKAKESGAPLQRTAQPGVYLAGSISHVLHVDGGRLVATPTVLDPNAPVKSASTLDAAVAIPAKAPSVPVTFDMLAGFVRAAYEIDVRPGAASPTKAFAHPSPEPTIVLFADKAALWAATKIAEAAAKQASGITPEAMTTRSIAKVLAYRASLPHSAFLPVLTTALTSRFWMQADLDENLFSDWCEAFGVQHSAPADQWARLLVNALDGKSNPKYVKGLLSSEKYGTLASQYGGALSSSKAFKQANAVQNMHVAITSTDPLLADFNRLGGDVAKVSINSCKDGSFTATIADGFKVKPGSDVLIFDLASEVGQTSEATLRSVDFVPGSEALLAQFSRGRRHSKTWWLIEQAAQNKRSLYVVAMPFTGGGAPVRISGRWAKEIAEGAEGAPTPLVRDVPVDVALAGAPEDY